jgi:hypothetical protein
MQVTEERIREVDSRLLEVRADYLACTSLVRACDEAIERLEAFNDVAGDRTRVPRLALARLRSVREDWSQTQQELAERMVTEARLELIGGGRQAPDRSPR